MKKRLERNINRIAVTFAAAGVLGICLLTGCGEKEPDPQTQSYEKGLVRLDANGNIIAESSREYPALEEEAELWLEDAENPAGQLQDTRGHCMVRVIAGRLAGSGVIFRSDERTIWIATAAHVLDELEDTVQIIFVDGFEAESRDVIRSHNQDLAIIRLPREFLMEEADAAETVDHGEYYRTALISQEAYDRAAAGDLVIAMGSHSGVAQDAYAGVLINDYLYLEDFEAYMMLAEVAVTPGMSGGGLFDAGGHLLGILCGVSEEGEVAAASVLGLLAMDTD